MEPRLIFSDAEFRRRWEALRAHLHNRRVEIALLTDADTIFYLTGFAGASTTFQALLAPRDGQPIHILRYAERASFDSSSWLSRAVTYADIDDPLLFTTELIEREFPRAPRIGIEKASPSMSLSRFELLSAALYNRAYVDISLDIGWQRLIKSPEEIAMHRRAADVIERALAAGVAAARPSATEREIGALVAAELIRAGADTPRIGVIGSAERLAQVHGGLSDRQLVHGDLVRLEMSNCVNRYWARIMRMLSLGEPAPETRELYDLLRQAQDEQLRQLRPGAIPAELDGLVRAQLPSDVWAMQLSGYALAFHEPSVIGGELDRYRIAADETRPLEAGMVLHMYLMVGELSISETVAVVPGGSEVLTYYPRGLIVR